MRGHSDRRAPGAGQRGVTYTMVQLDAARGTESDRAMNTFLSIGTGPRIGLATSARFAREGYQTVLCNRHVAKLQKLADCLGAHGRRVGTRAVDAGEPESVAALTE
jgi:NAD(P)-dependent dehydrogenase (short-subunit alcohol dehydrogenase family)